MTNRVGVEVAEGGEELLHDLGRFSLIKVLVLDYVVEQLATLTVLDD